MKQLCMELLWSGWAGAGEAVSRGNGGVNVKEVAWRWSCNDGGACSSQTTPPKGAGSPGSVPDSVFLSKYTAAEESNRGI